MPRKLCTLNETPNPGTRLSQVTEEGEEMKKAGLERDRGAARSPE